ncbi:MAG TPA: HAD family hydrolase [Micromonosporaceae bacterium]|nr:HAD family hydrolase [Micromonosporaceae bacterium]
MDLPKLVATDLDGTLVRSDDTVSDYSLRVLRKVREAGITVVGVTGRGARLIELCRRDLPYADFFVLAQGGYVVDQRDPDNPRVLRRRQIPGEDLARALDLLEKAAGPLSVLVEALDDPRAPLWGDADSVWPYPEWIVYDRPAALAGPVYKGFARADGYTADELLAIARQVIDPDLATVTQAGLGYVEITAPGVDKGTGLALVTAELDLTPDDVLVFGDMPNDVPMFRWARWRRVAVANAHPEVLAVADEVTASNDADGVAAWLEAMLSRP